MGIKYGTIEKIVSAFIERECPPWHRTIKYVDGVLYSFGTHYPLLKLHKDVYIGNSNVNSITTNQHRSAIRSYFRMNPDYFIELPYCDHREVHEYHMGNIKTIEDQARNRRANIRKAMEMLAEAVANYRQACHLLEVQPEIRKRPEDYVRWFLESNPEIKSRYVLDGMKK